jgi:hypothetical protein
MHVLPLRYWCCLGLLAAITCMAWGDDPRVPAPSLPAIAKLEIEPPRLVLNGARDSRRVLVTGVTADGQRFDLTRQASFESGGTQVEVAPDGFFTPKSDGVVPITVQACGQTATFEVTVAQAASDPPISFLRDVMPILTKAGCNAGTCHGAAKGRNGFRLSLRGYDPDFDYHALVDDLAGRRFNRADPAQSLMVLKPTGGVPHQGGFLFESDSKYAKTLERWIAEGVRNDATTQTQVERLEVLPATIALDLPGRTQQVIAIAHYADGSTRDVTREANYTSSMTDVATTTQDGYVNGVRRGEASLILRYEGAVGTVAIIVMGDRAGYQWQPTPEFNFIDSLVYQKLKAIKVLPAELCTDAEFIRRLYLDLTGQTPPPEKVRAFLADKSDNKAKRDQLVDELVGSQAYVDHWTHKWCDLLQVNRKFLGEKGMWAFHSWVRQAIAENRPYDQFVRELLTGAGDPDETATAAANFLRVNEDSKQATENTTQLFLGTRFSCCQCHDHPFEKWTQQQYFGLTAFYARSAVAKGAEPRVFDRRDGGETLHPKTHQPVPPRTPYALTKTVGPRTHGSLQPQGSATRRQELAAWLTAPGNPLFARSMANRTWSYFFHRGIIDPVDDIRSSNPPSNPALLDALTEEFLKHNFDLQHLARTICKSRVYQHSYKAGKWNEDDTLNFARAIPRRLTAEQIMDSLMQATGSPTAFPKLPKGLRASQLPDANFSSGGFMEQFGKPARESSCECERSSEVSLSQAMLMINGPTLANAITDPAGRLAKLLKDQPDDGKLAEELYLAAWSRLPTEGERAKALDHLKKSGNRAEAAQDLLWALLNSPAFLFNY